MPGGNSNGATWELLTSIGLSFQFWPLSGSTGISADLVPNQQWNCTRKMVVTRLRCKPIVLAFFAPWLSHARARYLQLALVKDGFCRRGREGPRAENRGQTADEAIVAFVNARRDSWYDPQGDLVMMSGWLSLLDAHGKQIAFVESTWRIRSPADLTDVRRASRKSIGRADDIP